jgi:copper chaperone NosL
MIGHDSRIARRIDSSIFFRVTLIATLLVTAAVLMAAAVLLTACASSPSLDDPPTILYGEDVCDRCMMIINEARYASAYKTSDGDTRRFDDIGGMILYDLDNGEDVAAYWVHDYETEEWLKAETATYVEDDNLHTPMGFGIIAFDSRERAESWAAEQGGMLMTFSELKTAGGEMGNSNHQHDS